MLACAVHYGKERKMAEDYSFEYVFPSIRGIQAKQEYYISMCPIRLLPRMFHFNETDIPAEHRAQRKLNVSRIPEMKHYILNNLDNYVFSAITASIDGEVKFEPHSIEADMHRSRMGNLKISMDAKFVINDGQHRRAAIEAALDENSDIANETIAVVFFLDMGLKRCQQMFADLNRYAIRPSRSLGILYDYRDDYSILAKKIVAQSDLFRNVVETEKSSLSARSRKLFTLSSIYSASKELLKDQDGEGDDRVDLAVEFWMEVARYIKEWQLVCDNQRSAGETRNDYVHSHSTVLQAIGIAGNALIKAYPTSWQGKLKKLSRIDWSRSNSSAWEGRAMVGGNIQKASNNVILTANYIKEGLGLKLTPEEQKSERAFLRGHHGK
jgi:DNA sulfur modification protein DndB